MWSQIISVTWPEAARTAFLYGLVGSSTSFSAESSAHLEDAQEAARRGLSIRFWDPLLHLVRIVVPHR